MQRSGDVELGIGAAQMHFAEIGGPAVQCNGPKEVGEIFRSKPLCGIDMTGLRLNARGAADDLNLGLTSGVRQKGSAGEFDISFSPPDVVVDGVDGLADDGPLIDRNRAAQAAHSVWLRRGRRRFLPCMRLRTARQQTSCA